MLKDDANVNTSVRIDMTVKDSEVCAVIVVVRRSLAGTT